MSARGNDYLPRPDGVFETWIDQFIAACALWWDTHGGDGNLDPLRDLRDEWEKAYAVSVSADAAAEAATAAKVTARAACEQAARDMVRLVQGTPDTTDAQRAAMGINIRRTPAVRTAAAPTTRPLVNIEFPTRLTHTLRLVDESTPTRTARPPRTIGAEVYVALTPPTSPAPADMESYRFVSITTRGAVEQTFPAADGGKTAHYQLRWISTRGEQGPWSDVCSATVAA